MFSAFDRQDVKNIGTWKVRNMETGQQNLAKHTGKLDRIILKQLVAKDYCKIHMHIHVGFLVFFLQTFIYLIYRQISQISLPSTTF